MKNIEFPVLTGGQSDLPESGPGPICPWCGKNKVLEPHSMAILSGGAMRKTGEDEYSSGDEEDLFAFMEYTWHGAHDDGEGIDREIGTIFFVAEKAQGGMLSMHFCSTDCLGAFLNHSVDKFEERIAEMKENRDYS